MTISKQTLLETFKEVISKEGVQALFKGLLASLWLVSNPIIQFWFYERFKKININNNNNNNNNFVFNFISGAVSKAIATIITFPYIVVRTYL